MTVSWQARIATWYVRNRVKPVLGDMSDLRRVRKVMNAAMPGPGGTRITPGVLGGVPGEWVEAKADAGKAPSAAPLTILYIHGGGFVGCSPTTHRPLTGALALQGARVFVPDYRLAPEHPFPAAPDDVMAAWLALHAQHVAAGSPGRIAVGGDSAGGNLAVSLMVSLRDAGGPLPDAAMLFSPGTDLTGGSESLVTNSDSDALFRGEYLVHLRDQYLQGADMNDPRASPLLASMHGLPPMVIHVARDEVLRDDGIRLAHKARAAGVAVELQVWPGVSHVWQLVWRLPEARRSVRQAVRFVRECAARGEPECHDVIVVGAGLSGIGAAWHLQQHCPEQRVLILEGRAASGGTWDLFRYPGVRSDSDMYTLGYRFQPWTQGKAIADGPAILDYIRSTAREHGIEERIRYQQRVVAADWSSTDARWTVMVQQGEGGPVVQQRCRFLYMCAGYYRYDRGYQPDYAGLSQFQGQVVHPQHWPEGLQVQGRRVVVIGSGATAVTLVPALAKAGAQVTMLQRSPTWIASLPARDAIADALRRWLPGRLAYALTRWKNVLLGQALYGLARSRPAAFGGHLLKQIRRALPGVDVDRHFTPSYRPWDQRLCLVPDGDLFTALRSGGASVVTDQIETFTPGGLRLRSGQELPADIVVSATGLELQLLGGAKLSLDGVPVDLSKTLGYKGMMFSDLPNMAATFGYTNASWTLKADLTAEYVCRVLNLMQRRGWQRVTPRRTDPDIGEMPSIDFSSGYVQRALAHLPKQGLRAPWRLYQNYLRDLLTLRHGRIEDGTLEFD
ncbi:MAG: hypothetical protein CFE46_11330 [Burkholderiales bacterium PBB6]|nr:MAG: hypothetical protein CFE46_11330 [Burkholderiales bacterium PBB6]